MSPLLRGWKAFLIFATFVTGGTVLVDVIGTTTAGLAILVVGGANAATDWYVAQTTLAKSAATPNEQVVVTQATPSAPAVATPAAAALGLVPGEVVDVASTTGPPPP